MTQLSASTLFSQPATWADMGRWHEAVGELRRNDGSVLIEPEGFAPFRVLLRHAEVFEASRDSATWLNTEHVVLMADEDQAQMEASGFHPSSLVQLDGDKHHSHRAIARDWFKPAAAKERQPRIAELADEFVDRMRDLDGACDFAADIAKPFTLRVIMEIYGVPASDEPLMMELTQGIFGAADPEYVGEGDDVEAKVLESMMRSINYFNELTADRRAHPRDDVASTIANAQIDGCPMGDVERLWYYIIIATAGHDTTSYAIAGGLEALLAHPEQFRALIDDPSLVDNAADEIIRWTSPVRHFLRYAAVDTEIAGHRLAAGDRVLLSYPSANRDEAVFADPDTFDVRRQGADKHLGFGFGRHFCLGIHVAQREVRTFLAALLERVADIEPAGEASWAESHFVSGVKHLPITYRMR
ncbi:MAG TPA: cytochrome P450 [Acidimicrobiales bacterium]|nr:cytochrome P450 [Acidimicrobiales bacterium]